jgi:Acetyl-CoA hydrolase/transferase C-terminal domain
VGVIEVSLKNAPALLARQAKDGRVFLPGGPVEPVALYEAFEQDPGQARGLTFCGMMIPGVNTRDWAALHPLAEAEVFLPSPELADTIGAGRTRVLPLHYSGAWRYLCHAPFKAAVFHVCPPDSSAMCNSSLSADSHAALIGRDVFKLAILNHGLPHIAGAPSVPLASFDAIVEIDEPPLRVAETAPSDSAKAIAGHIATIVDNGATLQTGIGKLPASVVAALTNHSGLKLHSGLIGDWALDLLAAGAFSDRDNALTAGVILGSSRLHEALSQERRLRLASIDVTHGAATLASLERFTSINAALGIDLYGQINCEFAGARTIAGIGGAVDFLRGARASKGGKPIIMITSEGKGGVSRIVPRLTTPSVSIARSDAPILVTEHGWVDLEPLDAQARAQAIINLAAPQHHEALKTALKDMRL